MYTHNHEKQQLYITGKSQVAVSDNNNDNSNNNDNAGSCASED